MRRNTFLFLILALAGCSGEPATDAPSFEELSAGFTEPPMSSRPGAFWAWLNGDVTKESITFDLEEMKAKGMGRAEIWDVEARNNTDGAFGIGPAFLGDESVDLIKHALAEGKRLGIRLGMVASSGWNAGGDWVEPDWAGKALYSSDTLITGPGAVSIELPFPEIPASAPRREDGSPVFLQEVAVLAVPMTADRSIAALSDIIALNDQFDGTTLVWDAPEGEWSILRFVNANTGQYLIVPSPNSNGLFIDFFDPEATKRHLGHILNRLEITRENGPEAGLGYMEFDSMELDEATPWTDAMAEIFESHHDYAIERYLPAFAGWTLPGGNDAFLYDFKKTVSDQLILSHYTTGRDFLAEHGIDLVAEAGGPGPPVWDTCPVDALKALGNVTVPRGEFWIQHNNIFLVKEVASASHIYGLGTVDAESFTTWRRWKDAPHAMKKWVDRAFVEGLNMVTFHTFANTRPEFGVPGRAYHAGVDINPTTTWWENAKPFNDYLSRTSYLLSQGLFVADVAYYYGDRAPNFFPARQESPDRPWLDGFSKGYDFDVVNTDVILNRMDSEEGLITFPDGLNYRLLVLPNIPDIPDEVVRRVENLVAAGAKVLIQNPDVAASFQGNILRDMTIDEALAELSIEPDFRGDHDKLEFIHRQVGSTDIYFVRNQTGEPLTSNVSFRATGRSVEVWDPVTGEQFRADVTTTSGGHTGMPLALPAWGSTFVVISNKQRDLPAYSFTKPAAQAQVQGPWTVTFPENWGAPPSIQLEELSSWIDHPDPGVQSFSGTGTYRTMFEVAPEVIAADGVLALDLGDVRDVAEVFVNGEPAGVRWTSPFRVDVQDLVRAGTNELEVRITNMWVNRLTADMDLPPEERFTRTNRPPFRQPRTPLGDETYRLQDSGLLGPVMLLRKEAGE